MAQGADEWRFGGVVHVGLGLRARANIFAVVFLVLGAWLRFLWSGSGALFEVFGGQQAIRGVFYVWAVRWRCPAFVEGRFGGKWVVCVQIVCLGVVIVAIWGGGLRGGTAVRAGACVDVSVGRGAGGYKNDIACT